MARRIKPDSAVARLILSDVEYARKLWGDAAKAAGATAGNESGAKHSYGDKAYSKKNTRKISLLVDLEGTPKYLLPKYTEWSDFNRTVANETSDLKDGDIRGIIVMTGSNVYSLICDGYMRGIIINKMPFNKIQYTRGVWNNEGTHSKSKNTYGNAEGETVRRLQWSRSNGINDGFREGARAYKLDDDESIGYKTGDSESSSFDDDSINNRFSSLEEALEWLRNYFNENENDTRHSYEDDIDKTIDKWSREAKTRAGRSTAMGTRQVLPETSIITVILIKLIVYQTGRILS